MEVGAPFCLLNVLAIVLLVVLRDVYDLLLA